MSDEDVPKFTCKNCGDSFRRERELSKHRRLDCKKKPYGCPECGQLLSRRDSLRQHLQRHGGGKKYPCKFCDKTFDQQQNLKVHLRIHSGERPYTCPQCGRQFNQSQNLTTHLRVHSGVKPYVCQICGATFRFCSGYRSHMSRSHDPSKPARKRGRRGVNSSCSHSAAPITTAEPKVREASVDKVHRVSVIAKVSTASYCSVVRSVFDKTGQCSTEPFEKTSVAIPSPFHAGLQTRTPKLGSAIVHVQPAEVQFTCRLCNVVALREAEIMQHMSVVHGVHQNIIPIKQREIPSQNLQTNRKLKV